LAQSKACSSACQSFKCAKNSLFFRGRDNVWCRETDEQCNVAKCTYSMCMKRRLLPEGICGEMVKRKTVEKDLDEELFDDEDPMRFKGKGLRKFGNKEIY
jgi:hypothetical protein